MFLSRRASVKRHPSLSRQYVIGEELLSRAAEEEGREKEEKKKGRCGRNSEAGGERSENHDCVEEATNTDGLDPEAREKEESQNSVDGKGDGRKVMMVCHHKIGVSNNRRTDNDKGEERQLPSSGGKICAKDAVDNRELRRTKEKRQAKNAHNEKEAGARSTPRSFGRKWSSLSQPAATTCTRLCCFKPLSTLVSVGLSVYAWLLVDLAGSRCTTTLQSVYSAAPVMVVEASSACAGNTDCVYSTKEGHENEEKTTGKHSCSCNADIDKTTDNVARLEGDFVLQATAHSTLLGEGFHRTMLTTVHISSSIADEKEKEEKKANNGRKLRQIRSGFDREVNVQTEESHKRLKEAFEREERERSEKEGEKETEKGTQEEEREPQSGNEKTVREGARERGAREGQKEAHRRSDAGKRGERTRGRENGSGTFSEEERKRNGRSEEERKTRVAESDNDDNDHLICTVTCEYALDKIVYVDPDQTWELDLKGHATLDTGKTGENKFHSSFSGNSAQVGSVEVLAPAVDIEAPVFVPYLPSKLRVRQTIENVLLKQSTEPKECSHTTALNHDIGIDKHTDMRVPRNAVSEDLALPSSNSQHNDGGHLDRRRKPEGKDGFYLTQGKGNATGDTSEHEDIIGIRNNGVYYKDQRSGKENTGEINNCQEGSPVFDTAAYDDHRSGSLNASIPDRGHFKKTNNSFEAFVNIELPLHHRYDAACSGCDGLSLHHIQTPVAKIVCCRNIGMREQAESQLPRIFHQSEAVRATNAADISGSCCDQKQIADTQHHTRTHFPSGSEGTIATEASTPHATSSYAYCISVMRTAIVVGDKQGKTDSRLKNASSKSNSYPNLKYCNDPPSLEKMTVNLSETAGITDLKAGHISDQGNVQVDQGAAEGTADGGRVNTEIDSGIWEGRRGSLVDGHCGEILSFQVPVGSAEDLPWVTAVTLTTIGVLMVLTAWILSYAEAHGGCWTGMTTKNAKQK